MTEVVKFSEIRKGRLNADPLQNLAGQVIRIVGVDFVDMGSRLGEATVFTLEDGKRYYTFSKIIRDQVKELPKETFKGRVLEALVTKRKNYLTLE